MRIEILSGHILAIFLLIASTICCAEKPPVYVQPEDSINTASIINKGMLGISTTNCQMPFTDKICLVAIALVDGNYVPMKLHSINVVSGLHTIRIVCSSWIGGPFIFGKTKGEIADVTYNFLAGYTYRLTGILKDGVCEVGMNGTAK